LIENKISSIVFLTLGNWI